MQMQPKSTSEQVKQQGEVLFSKLQKETGKGPTGSSSIVSPSSTDDDEYSLDLLGHPKVSVIQTNLPNQIYKPEHSQRARRHKNGRWPKATIEASLN